MKRTDLDILHSLTETDVRDMFSRNVWERARTYHSERRVQSARRHGTELTAQVQGTRLYDVCVGVKRRHLSWSCTCPFAETGICKHVGAVLLQWIHRPESFALANGRPVPASTGHPDLSIERGSAPLPAPWWYDQLEYTSSCAPDSDLESLLACLTLPELQRIARQHKCKLPAKNARKADYVAALASLLSDPTAIVRTTSRLPHVLRETLRAALIAERGDGITPSTVAHVMTALRRDDKTPVKPVQAAGFLADLSHWGLVIPWHDSPSLELRHLFLWHIQRQIPPLPGWCPQWTGAPSRTAVSANSSSVPRAIYTVWERISQDPPALCVPHRPATSNALKRLTRSRALPSRPAFLLDDAAVSSLTSCADGDPEQVEFVCHVLHGLNLVQVDDGHLLARPRAMTRFLSTTAHEQHSVIFQAYTALTAWSELDVLLRASDPPSMQLPVYSFSSRERIFAWLVHLRHMLLRFVATAGEGEWCKLTDMDTALRLLWPRWSDAMQDRGRDRVARSVSLPWPQETDNPTLGKAQKWQMAQGRFLRIVLEGPLSWLGVVDLCHCDGRLTAFRSHGLADLLWDRITPPLEETTPRKAVSLGRENLTLAVDPSAIPPRAHELLGRIAQLEQTRPGCFIYRLDMRTAHAAFERGESLADLFAAWDQALPSAIPVPLREALTGWWTSYAQVRLYEGLALLELGDDSALIELEATTSLTEHIVAKLSPRLVLVSDDTVEPLLDEFAARGHTATVAR